MTVMVRYGMDLRVDPSESLLAISSHVMGVTEIRRIFRIQEDGRIILLHEIRQNIETGDGQDEGQNYVDGAEADDASFGELWSLTEDMEVVDTEIAYSDLYDMLEVDPD